jgi:hypothetical protein
VPHVTALVQPGHQPVSAPPTVPSVSIGTSALSLGCLLQLFVDLYWSFSYIYILYVNLCICYLKITEFVNGKVNSSEPSSSEWQEHIVTDGKKLVSFLLFCVVDFMFLYNLIISCLGSLNFVLFSHHNPYTIIIRKCGNQVGTNLLR